MSRTALITGATSGIGQCLASRLAPDHELLLTGRKPLRDVAEHLPDGAAYVVADQTQPDAATAAIVEAIGERGWDRLDLVVLNAGAGFVGDPVDEQANVMRQVLDTNSVSTMRIARALFEPLSAAGGKLVLIGSVAHRGNAAIASYAASKAAIHGFGRALAEEWRGRVTVQVIHPGPTASGMHAKAGLDVSRAERFFVSTEKMTAIIEDLIASGRPQSTASYARFLSRFYWARTGR